MLIHKRDALKIKKRSRMTRGIPTCGTERAQYSITSENHGIAGEESICCMLGTSLYVRGHGIACLLLWKFHYRTVGGHIIYCGSL